MKRLLYSVFIFISITTLAQATKADSLSYALLKRIAYLQKEKDGFFLEGVYASYINSREKFSKKKKDNTIFYNALIDKTLLQIKPTLAKDMQIEVERLLQYSAGAYTKFKNPHGRLSYNFWRRDSVYRFPYSWWIPLLKKDALVPDDMDDTVFALMAQQASKDSAIVAHQLFQSFTNKHQNTKTTENAYRHLQAYSTWFGEKFPIVFDVSVLSNILFFVQEYQLPWTLADSASLQLIVKSIDEDAIVYKPALVSPYYPKTALIVYHFARLMAQKSLSVLDERKEKLKNIALALFYKSENLLEKTILSTALLRLGEDTKWYQELLNKEKNKLLNDTEQNDYAFFVGNIPSYFHYTWKKIFTQLGVLQYYHFSPAYNHVLLLEYLSIVKSNKI